MSIAAAPFGTRGGRFPLAALAGVGCALLLGLGAVLQPPLALAAVLGLAFVWIAFADLAAGLAVFVFLIFFERIPGVETSGFTFVKAAGAVLALSWVAAVMRRDARVPVLLRDRPGLSYVAVALVAWTLVSQLWAQDSSAALGMAVRLAQGVVLVFIVYTALRERQHVRWVLWAFVLGAAATALVGIAGGSSAESFDPGAETSRLTGQIGDPNELAAILAPALWLAAFGMAATSVPLRKWLLLTAALVIALGLFLTESRGGIVALAVTIVAAVFLGGPMRLRSAIAGLVLGSLGVGYYALVAPPEALRRITEFSAGGGTGRTDLWSVAVEIIADHPIFGVGAGNFVVVEPSYAARGINIESIRFVVDTPLVAHNTYLHVLAELGIVGLTLFVVLAVTSMVVLWRAARLFRLGGDDPMELWSRALLVGLLGMFAAYTFLSAQYEKQLWLVLGVAVSMYSVARRELAPAEDPETGAHYDHRVSERLVEQLERRFSERMDALLAEQQRLERKRALIAERERALGERAPVAPAAVVVGDDRAADLDRRHELLAQREQALARRAAEVATRERAVRELEELARSLEGRAAEVEERARQLDERAASFERETLQQVSALERRSRELGEQVNERAGSAEEREAELARRAQELTDVARSLEARTAALDARAVELERQAEARAAAIEARAQELEELARSLDARSAELEERLVDRETTVELERGVRERVEALEARAAELERLSESVAERTAELERREREVEARAAAVDREAEERIAALARRSDALEQEHEDRHTELAQRAEALTQLASSVEERSAALERRAEELDRQAREAAAALEARAAELERREQEAAASLEARAAELERREREAAASLEARAAEREARDAPRARPEPVAAAPAERPPAPAAPAPAPGPAASATPGLNVFELERLVDAHAADHPDLADEWRYYLVYLRDYAGADGALPASFDALVDEVFGTLRERG